MRYLLLFLALPAYAENYRGTLGAEVVSDFEASAFQIPLKFRWQGDPFAAVPGYSSPLPAAVLPAPAIQATMPHGDKPLAVVNDRVVGVGERVDGKRIRGIGENYVLLEDGASVKEVSLTPAPEGAPSRAPASLIDKAVESGMIQIEERPAKK